MLNNVKVRLRSVKEAEKVLSYLFANGHAWRGGSTNSKLSEYEVNNLVGIYIEDTCEMDVYNQTAAVTFETNVTSFWSIDGLSPMPVELVLNYYIQRGV